VKEVIEAVNSRINTPYFGYSILAFLALNWRGFFYLVFSKGKPEEKLALFDAQTDVYTLLIYPLAIGALVAAITPWLRFLFGKIEKKPKEMYENQLLEATHNKTIKQTQLEQSRSDLFAVKEQELIERAKRDDEITDIENPETKEKLINQLNVIRSERDKLSQELQNKQEPEYSLSKEATEILFAASQDKSGSIRKSQALNARSIQAGGNSFGLEDQRTYAKYEAALEQLVDESIVKERGYEGNVFELTHKGWEMTTVL
jgi:hypothetical protein